MTPLLIVVEENNVTEHRDLGQHTVTTEQGIKIVAYCSEITMLRKRGGKKTITIRSYMEAPLARSALEHPSLLRLEIDKAAIRAARQVLDNV